MIGKRHNGRSVSGADDLCKPECRSDAQTSDRSGRSGWPPHASRCLFGLRESRHRFSLSHVIVCPLHSAGEVRRKDPLHRMHELVSSPYMG
jgi:hypothetical protein